jgi:hypothetical protein
LQKPFDFYLISIQFKKQFDSTQNGVSSHFEIFGNREIGQIFEEFHSMLAEISDSIV